MRKILIIAIIMTFAGMSVAYSQATGTYRIQALFLYNFTKHVKWENSVNESLTVGVFGNPMAHKEIKKNLESKKAWGKNIVIVEIKKTEEMSNCHIVYIPKSNKKKILEFIGGAELSHTLLVTEGDFINVGAAISFVYEQSKMKFKISKTKIEAAGLKVSSTLISIGIPV